MTGATRICKICGKEYPFCYTVRHDSAFRWQDVACCPEHGSAYLKKVLISRGEYVEPEQTAAENTVDLPDPEEDEEEDEDEEE